MKKRSAPAFIIPLALLIVFSLISCALSLASADLTKYVPIASGLCGLCALVLLIVTLVFNYNLTRYVTTMDKDIITVGRETFYDYPEPIVIVDEDEKVIWYNASFEEHIFGEDRAYGIHL
ncbi:MAG: hypothetical protein IJX54_05980, partial [Oscillospiraceae bacterium]|nr:hypothetical protein [Oscillospiraceae bacterium]